MAATDVFNGAVAAVADLPVKVSWYDPCPVGGNWRDTRWRVELIADPSVVCEFPCPLLKEPDGTFGAGSLAELRRRLGIAANAVVKWGAAK